MTAGAGVILSLAWAQPWSGVPAGSAHAAIDPTASEGAVHLRLNSDGWGAGIAPMNLDAAVPMAIEGASREGRRRPSHRPDLAARASAIAPSWSKLGENVGTGGSVTSLHTAFMNSPGHRANVLGDYNRVSIAVIVDGARIWVTFDFMKGPPVSGATGLEPALPTIPFSQAGNFWVATANGKVYGNGTAKLFGDMSTRVLARPIDGMAASPTGNGYWLVASDGGIFAFGDALFYGSTGALTLNQPIVAMAPTSTGKGLLARRDRRRDIRIRRRALPRLDGRGEAESRLMAGRPPPPSRATGGRERRGSSSSRRLFYGSAASRPLPATGHRHRNPAERRRVLAQGSTGAVYPFGAAGAMGGEPQPHATLIEDGHDADGLGYRMASADGRIFLFGSGGTGVTPPLGVPTPVVAIATSPRRSRAEAH